MGFTLDVMILAAERVAYLCEVCGTDTSRLQPGQTSASFEIHSATSLHLVRSSRYPDMCVVTSPPPDFKKMRGRLLPAAMFRVFDDPERDDDAFCLCLSCHDEIHKRAQVMTRVRVKGSGKNAIPALLESVTLFFVRRGYFDPPRR